MSLKFTVVARKNLSKGAPEDSKLFYAQARFAVDRDVEAGLDRDVGNAAHYKLMFSRCGVS